MHLIYQFTIRELQAKYRGSFLGLGWSFFTPIALLIVFTFVFNHLFQMKWPSVQWDSTLGFALFTFCGLIIFLAFSECIGRASSLIQSQPNLVTKVVFPLYVLPVSMCLASLVQVLISLAVLMVVLLFVGQISFDAVAVILILGLFFGFLIGLSLLLSALGVYLRDLTQITGLLTTLMMFLSPIFYPLSSLSEDIQFWLFFNPLVVFMEATREVLLLNTFPSFHTWALMSFWCVLFLILGIWTFHKLKKGFADVI